MVERKAVKPPEACEMLGISSWALRQLVHEGRLGVIWIGTGTRRKHFIVPLTSIDSLLKEASHAEAGAAGSERARRATIR